MKQRRTEAGFSLLELLVVISIIGILLAIGAVGFTAAQRRGRDARRRADMQAWQDALEQLYAEETDYDGDPDNGCQAAVTANMNGEAPTDPKPSQSYTTDCDDDEYCLCATLERADGNNSASDCSGWTTGDGDYYCVSNLQ